ncbi:MAG: 30S ribosome-binding factor RbfA [Chloroflexota bacterium]
MTHRMPKVNHLIQRELSELLRREAKDPRLTSMMTVTAVSTSADLSRAKVFVSIMGAAEEKKRVLDGLRAASKFFRRELAARLYLRRMPELDFCQDDSIERGAHLLELIDRAVKGEDA